MEATCLENLNNLIGDGHNPNHSDEEPHRTAQDAHGWVFSLRRKDENEDASCDTGDGGGNKQPYLMFRSVCND